MRKGVSQTEGQRAGEGRRKEKPKKDAMQAGEIISRLDVRKVTAVSGALIRVVDVCPCTLQRIEDGVGEQRGIIGEWSASKCRSRTKPGTASPIGGESLPGEFEAMARLGPRGISLKLSSFRCFSLRGRWICDQRKRRREEGGGIGRWRVDQGERALGLRAHPASNKVKQCLHFGGARDRPGSLCPETRARQRARVGVFPDHRPEAPVRNMKGVMSFC